MRAVEHSIYIFCKGVRHTFTECPVYDTKTFDGETPVLDVRGMWSTPWLTLLTAPLWTGVGVYIRLRSLDQTKQFNNLLELKPFLLIELLVLNSNTGDHLTMRK